MSAGAGGPGGGDVYGGWEPATLLDLVECEADPYITPAGVVPRWVADLQAAATRQAVVHRPWWHHDSNCTDPRCLAVAR